MEGVKLSSEGMNSFEFDFLQTFEHLLSSVESSDSAEHDNDNIAFDSTVEDIGTSTPISVNENAYDELTSGFVNVTMMMPVEPAEIDPCYPSSFTSTSSSTSSGTKTGKPLREVEAENCDKSHCMLATANRDRKGNSNCRPSNSGLNSGSLNTINNPDISSVMLSPPSSSISDGEIDVACDNLFPELECLQNSQDETYFYTNSHVTAPSHRNVVRVNVSQVIPKSEPHSPANYSVLHHNYASHDNDDGVKRLPKYVEFEPDTGFEVCGPMSKNAVLARENRRKKKEYVSNLESQIAVLKGEKSDISNSLSKAYSTIDGLKDEVEYLKSVIANETTLGALLKNIPHAAGVSIKRGRSSSSHSTTHNIKTKRHKAADHDYISSTKSRPGVCLHVAEGSVSLEFCKHCSTQSQLAE